jgi:1-acyl-sn-glycerol-3-phosphate acyltransferase
MRRSQLGMVIGRAAGCRTKKAQNIPLAQRVLLASCAILVRSLLFPVARLEIPEMAIGPEPRAGLIIAANHRSMLDMFVGMIVFRKWKIYPNMLVRGDFCQMPVIGRLLRSLGAVPAGRGHSPLRLAQGLLACGGTLVITPEGRIVRPEERVDGLGNLRPGVGYIAAAHGTPILLVAMVNTDACWPLGARFPRVRLLFGNRPIIRLSAEMIRVEPGGNTRQVVDEVRSGLSRLLSNGR